MIVHSEFFNTFNVLILTLLKRQPYKMVKHTQTIRRLFPTNCLSVIDHLLGLVLKGLMQYFLQMFTPFRTYIHLHFNVFQYSVVNQAVLFSKPIRFKILTELLTGSNWLLSKTVVCRNFKRVNFKLKLLPNTLFVITLTIFCFAFSVT